MNLPKSVHSEGWAPGAELGLVGRGSIHSSLRKESRVQDRLGSRDREHPVGRITRRMQHVTKIIWTAGERVGWERRGKTSLIAEEGPHGWMG